MPLNLTTFETTLETKLNAALSTNESKELLLLAKAAEAVNNSVTVKGGTINGNLAIANNGNLTVAGNATVTGDLVVNGTTTTVNSTTLDVADLNITIADGATNAAAANGAGITVDGASATMLYTSSTDTWDFNKAITGSYTNLHPVVTTLSSTTTEVIDLTKPMQHITMTGATTFQAVSVAAGRTTMVVLDTSTTPHTPSWNTDIKWPDATEPTWADRRYWIVSLTAIDATTTLASAQGYTV